MNSKKFNFVYLTICKINGKCYVGSHTTNNENYDINRYYGGGVILQKAIKKYKKQNFHRIILKFCDTIIEARNLERHYIQLFNTLNPFGYNISPTGGMGENQFGLHSEDTKEILRKIRLGKTPWNKGKKYEETYDEEKAKKIKKNLSNLASKKIGEKNPNFGNKGEKNPLFGVEKSKEHKEKLKISKIGSKNPNSGTYEIITPDNKKYIVFSATEFITQHPEYNINRHFIYKISKMNNYYKGWKIVKIK